MVTKLTSFTAPVHEFDKQAFWQFGYDFYQLPDVEKTLLVLQNQFGLNVNLTLFLIWYSYNFQHIITTRHIERLLDAIAIQDEWVAEFRSYRKDFTSKMQNQLEIDITDVKQSLLDSELTLEALVQAAIIQYAKQNLLSTAPTENIKIIEVNFIANENLDCYFQYIHPEQQPRLWDATKLLLSRLTEFLNLSVAA
ncbi:MAG: TIGR02444 family protein [Kangiellaceae bacterium]|jgi:uncharacterized protein (TIGR02444 family)|nr:TIGR02444 family protein [Kangiellaceae bacterium]